MEKLPPSATEDTIGSSCHVTRRWAVRSVVKEIVGGVVESRRAVRAPSPEETRDWTGRDADAVEGGPGASFFCRLGLGLPFLCIPAGFQLFKNRVASGSTRGS